MGYSEADTKAKLITPQLLSNGWSENHIVREYFFTVVVKMHSVLVIFKIKRLGIG